MDTKTWPIIFQGDFPDLQGPINIGALQPLVLRGYTGSQNLIHFFVKGNPSKNTSNILAFILIPNGSHENDTWNILKSKLEVLKYKSERIPIWHLLPTRISDWWTLFFKDKKQKNVEQTLFQIIPYQGWISSNQFQKHISWVVSRM